MRINYKANTREVLKLKLIVEESKSPIDICGAFKQAISFFYNVRRLIKDGYKICLIDPKGNKKFFGGNNKKGDDDEQEPWDED